MAKKGILSFLSRIRSRGSTNLTQLRILRDGDSYISKTNTGTNDVLASTIDRVANTISKTVVIHRSNAGVHPTSIYSKLLNRRPNEVMPPTMFYYMITHQLFVNSNALVFIEFDTISGKPKQLIPIDWNNAQFMSDPNGKLWIKVNVKGNVYILPYESIIHLRRNFRTGVFGTSPSDDIQPQINLMASNTNALNEAINSNGTIKAILKLDTHLSKEKMKAYKDGFVSDYVNDLNTSGLAVLDSRAEFKELKNDYKFVEGEQQEDLRASIYRYYGINKSIAEADFSEDQYTSYMEMTIEPLVQQFTEEFSYKLFTYSELDKGNELLFTTDKMQVASLRNKGEYIKLALEGGAMTLNEARQILGLPRVDAPMADTNRVSLNNVDVNIVNEYQRDRARTSTPNPKSEDTSAAVEQEKKTSETDDELTNFPNVGSDKEVVLKNSNHKQFDFFFAKKHPELLSETDLVNFTKWEQVREREKDQRPLTKKQQAWVLEREKLLTHLLEEEKRGLLVIPTFVGYGGIISKGQEEMKNSIEQEIKRRGETDES